MNLIEKKKIILEVPFQREYVWDNSRGSQLIESVIMNVPIPPVYFAEEEDGMWLVIDGLQRLFTLKKFYTNEFSLRGLDILKELNKLKYKDLPNKALNLLDNGQLRVNVIRKDSHPDIKYDVFMRLNSGAVTLNYQELRNCLYRGNFNKLCKELNKTDPYFLKILGQKKEHQRFLDVEFIIRLLAVDANVEMDQGGNYKIRDYSGKMVTFINEYMKSLSKATDEDLLRIKEKFTNKIKTIVEKFGISNTFRDITSDKIKVNKALAECIFAAADKYDLVKDDLNVLLNELLTNDATFKSSISLKTTDKTILTYRINTWLKLIDQHIEK